jgi:atypical dual specificity phosphatase
MIAGFYWLLDGALAGCSRPGARGARNIGDSSEAAEALAGDLDWLRSQGIGALLSLTETPLDFSRLPGHRFEVLHLPVPDLTAPTPEQLQQSLAFIDIQRSLGLAVAVHCLVGQGRTGTVLAAYLIRGGRLPDAAITTVRARCPGAIGSPEQERALHAFSARRDWIF